MQYGAIWFHKGLSSTGIGIVDSTMKNRLIVLVALTLMFASVVGIQTANAQPPSQHTDQWVRMEEGGFPISVDPDEVFVVNALSCEGVNSLGHNLTWYPGHDSNSYAIRHHYNRNTQEFRINSGTSVYYPCFLNFSIVDIDSIPNSWELVDNTFEPTQSYTNQWARMEDGNFIINVDPDEVFVVNALSCEGINTQGHKLTWYPGHDSNYYAIRHHYDRDSNTQSLKINSGTRVFYPCFVNFSIVDIDSIPNSWEIVN